jgi:glycosyltransferase involved in cell wall biosynthesis
MSVVFIPTRNRVELIERVLPKWQQQDVDEIVLMVERQERGSYKKVVRWCKNVSTFQLPESNRGINYSRNQIVMAANSMGCDRIIMSDDDIFPRPDSDINRLYEWKGLNTLGIGIMVPFYGLMFGNKTIKAEDRPLMSKGALGKRCFSLNIKRVIAIGNFDVRLHSGWGDDELVRQGMAALQATWYVHAGVNGTSIAGRYTKGGINDFHNEDQEARQRGQELSHRIIYKNWGPKYVSNPEKRMAFRWKLFMDDYVPDWEKRIDWEKQ